MLRRTVLYAVTGVLAGNTGAWAQKAPVVSRVAETVDDTRTVPLRGNVHPLARAASDRGALADSQPLTRMLLLLQRSQEQEQALRELLDAQQTKGSGSYHAWLTPEQFGKQFGPSDADVRAVTDWLARQGFTVKKVAAGRTVIEFDGNVAQVRYAFHTEIHRFLANGEERFANVSDPAIPAALSPVVAGVVSLHNFPKHAQVQRVGIFQRDLASRQVKPLFTYTDKNGTFYGVGPADFAKIYNIPLTATGSGQSIAIVGDSNINIQDVRDFRSMFGLPPNDPQIVVNGPDPGLAGDEIEADLDVEWAGAVAPAANIIFVTSEGAFTTSTAGIDLSALYVIDNNLAPVMSESFGECERFLTTAGNAFYNTLWEQAAAEGITIAIAAGDNGPAGCDPGAPPLTQNAATQGLAVSGLASTPFNVAVGGTDFDQFNNEGAYWNITSTSTTPPVPASALGYIPEIPWDDSNCAAQYPTACTSANLDPSGLDLVAGSGGPSAVYTTKPPFQSGLTPNDSARDLPDVSLFAGNGFNNSFYIVCQSDANPGGAPCDLATSPTSGTHNFSGVGGTSGGTPAFAAIVALINEKTGQRQGNINYALYALAAKETYTNCNSSSFTSPGITAPASCTFYDITKGNNGVACAAGSPNCSNTTTSGFGVIQDTASVYSPNGTPAFKAATGYDLATGLGSINVGNLLNNWSLATRTPTTTTLSNASGTTNTSGQNFSVKVTVTPTAATGDVSLTALASDQTTILGSVACCGSTGLPFSLSGGSVTVSTNLLPPGTAYIQGYYGGSATYAASKSTPPLALAVSGANQASKTTVGFVTFDVNNNPILPPNTGSISAAYGSPYILQIAVTNLSGTSCTSGGTATTNGSPCPIGTVTLTDHGAPLNDWPIAGQVNATNVAKLNNQGIAEDQPIQLSAGTHSIVASFIASNTTTNNNYADSTSNTLSVTITPAATSTTVSSNLSSIPAGQSVLLTATVSTNSNGEAPCGITNGGTVQFTNNGTAISGTVTYTPTSGAVSSTGLASCTATLTTAISSLYPPPTGGPNTPAIPRIPVIAALLSLLLFALGLRWIPQTRRRAYAYAGLLAIALLAGVVAGCGGGSGGTNVNARTIGATYSGDTNYGQSVGTTIITIR